MKKDIANGRMISLRLSETCENRSTVSAKKFAYLKYPRRARLPATPSTNKDLALAIPPSVEFLLEMAKPKQKLIRTEPEINVKYQGLHQP